MGTQMGWTIYGLVVLISSGLIGMHLGRFREAYTEMTGMMAGMMMGMLNGFLLGYAAAAVTNSLFLGNALGILLGLGLGAYFGRAGGLMGIMDGAMGGVMGGSMGAMLAVMVVFPPAGLIWTGVLLGAIYIAGMVGLVVLIERSAPEHAALHRLMPMFTRAVAVEAAEEADAEAARRASGKGYNSTVTTSLATRERRVADYYAILDVADDATSDEIEEAYHDLMAQADDAKAARLERALDVLTNPQKRGAYDVKLAQSRAAVDPVHDRQSGATQPVHLTANEQARGRPSGRDSGGRSSFGVAKSPPAAKGRGTIGAQPQSRGQAKQSSVRIRPKQDDKQGKQATQAPGSRGNKGDGQRRNAQPVRSARAAQPAQQRTTVSASGIRMLALLLPLLAIGWWALSGSVGSGTRVPTLNGQDTQGANQLEAQAVSAPLGADGKQTLDVVVDGSARGYKPGVIKVKQGVPVRFNLSIEGADPG